MERQERESREIAMYGATIAEFIGESEKSLFVQHPQYGGWKALIMSHLSDVQELAMLEGEESREQVRLILNRVKYILDNKV